MDIPQKNLLTGHEILERLRTNTPQDYSNLIRTNKHHFLPLLIISYSKTCNFCSPFDPSWDDLTLGCRGIIINTETEEIWAKPWNKFFNFDPDIHHHDISKNSYTLEKLDGSLGISYRDPLTGKVRISTKGSFTSPMAHWATDVWLATRDWIPEDVFDQNLTYLFEIIYPEQRGKDGSMTLVDYGNVSECFLIGIIDTKTGEEFHWNFVSEFANRHGIKTPKKYDFKEFGEILSKTKELPWNDEGYVVTLPDNNFYKYKLKGQEYCRIHRTIFSFGTRAIWCLLRDKKYNFPEILSNIPFDAKREKLNIYYKIIDEANSIIESWRRKAYKLYDRKLTRKELAIKIQQGATSKKEMGIVFNILDDYDGSGFEKLFYKALKEIEEKYKQKPNIIEE